MTKIILIRGPMGAGKSIVAKLLWRSLPNASWIEEDAIKRNIDPIHPTKWRSNTAFDTALFLTDKLIKQHRVIVADIHASKPDRYFGYRTLARINNYSFHSFLLRPPLEECLKRNRQRIIPDINYTISDDEVKKYWKNIFPVENEPAFRDQKLSPSHITTRILELIN